MPGIPQPGALFGLLGPGKVRPALVGGQLLYQLHLLGHAGRAAMELEEQRVAFAQVHLAVGVDGADGGRVKEFAARQRHAQLDGLDDDIDGLLGRREVDHRGRYRLGQRMQAQRDFGDDAQRALGPHKEAGQVIAGRGLAGVRAGMHHLPFGRHHGQRQHVLAHGAVAHGVGARGTGGRHAADGGIRARIDGEEEPGVMQLLIELLAGHAGLHCHQQVFGGHRHDAVHPRHVQRDAASDGQQLPFDGRACPPGHDRTVMRATELHQIHHVLGALGKHHPFGQGQRVDGFIAAVVLAHPVRHREAFSETLLQRGLQGFVQPGRRGALPIVRHRLSWVWIIRVAKRPGPESAPPSPGAGGPAPKGGF